MNRATLFLILALSHCLVSHAQARSNPIAQTALQTSPAASRPFAVPASSEQRIALAQTAPNLEPQMPSSASEPEPQNPTGVPTEPAVAFINALIIIFREGFEAVLILAALLGSLKRSEARPLRRSLWQGVAVAFIASLGTFWLMRDLVSAFEVYGEKLEAVVNLIAVMALLFVMNWFFQRTDWNNRLASYHKQKQGLINTAAGQTLGLFVLGFSAIYREGFETAVFLQALTLQNGWLVVSLGGLSGLAIVAVLGLAVFKWQTKLPHKKMLIATGVLMCAVLGIMVGNTVHALQESGWFWEHSLGTNLPNWMSQWLGIYPTWEGITAQIVAISAVLSSYFLAEHFKHQSLKRKSQPVSSAGQ